MATRRRASIRNRLDSSNPVNWTSAELLGGQSLINDRLTLNIISNTIIQLEIMQVDQLSADTICTK